MTDRASAFKSLRGYKPQSGGKAQACCPAHDDKTPSLTITYTDTKILLTCHRGCPTEAIVSAMGLTMADLFLNDDKPEPRKVVAVYKYQDFEVVRYEPKDFRQRRSNGNGGYTWNLGDVTRTLYHNNELPEAIEKGTTIYISEGEKDCDRLRILGLTATTNSGGAGKWQDNYTTALQGADLVIIPDNDPPGKDHAAKIATTCQATAKRVRILELPDKDVSDWLDNGGDVTQLQTLADACPTWEPLLSAPVTVINPDEWAFTDNGTAYTFTNITLNTLITFSHLRQHKTSSDLTAQVSVEMISPPLTVHFQNLNLMAARSRPELSKHLKERLPGVDWTTEIDSICLKTIKIFSAGEPVQEIWGDLENSEALKAKFLIEPLLYEHESNVFFGPGENAKSYIAIFLCVLARLPDAGIPFGLKVKAANPLYLDYERSQASFKARLSAICRGLQVAPVPIAYRRCSLPFADDIDRLIQIGKEGEHDLVVIDSVGIACAGELNSSEVATRFASALHKWPITNLLITHTSKTEDGRKTPIGSVYFSTAPANIFEIKKAQENGSNKADIALLHYKNNLGHKIEPMGFRLEFKPDMTQITRQDVSDMPMVFDNKPLHVQVKELLEINRSMSAKDIALALDKTDGNIRGILNRYKKVFRRQGENWCNV